jgi:hypothetical protein
LNDPLENLSAFQRVGSLAWTLQEKMNIRIIKV